MDDNSKTPKQATPHGTLLEQIMDPCQPKTEREWAAKREIERLQDAIQQTLDEHRNLADGENCTLLVLKQALPASQATDAEFAERIFNNLERDEI